MPTQNQKITLTPNVAQVQLAVASFGGSTLSKQTSLSVQASPATLTLKTATTDGNKITVVIDCGDDTVQSVTDDTGNSYSRLSTPVNPNDLTKQFEVWRCEAAVSMTGVIVTTTNGGDILRALVTEVLPLPAYALAAQELHIAEPPVSRAAAELQADSQHFS